MFYNPGVDFWLDFYMMNCVIKESLTPEVLIWLVSGKPVLGIEDPRNRALSWEVTIDYILLKTTWQTWWKRHGPWSLADLGFSASAALLSAMWLLASFSVSVSTSSIVLKLELIIQNDIIHMCFCGLNKIKSRAWQVVDTQNI